MQRTTISLLFLVLLPVACTLAVPTSAPIPASLPDPSPVPSPQSTYTAIPTAISSATLPQLTRTPTRTASPLPTFARTLAATRFPTPVSRATEIARAQCPFNIPVKIIAPGLDPGGFDWKPVIVPSGDPCVSKMRVAPNDERTWYVGGQTALYITRDEGKTWERPLTGQVSAIELDPNNPNRVFVGFQVAGTIYESSDQGRNWRMLKKFDQGVMSMLVSGDGAIIVGPHWGDSQTANGVYVSLDRGATWQHSPFGTTHRGLILWDIAQDPRDQTLYVGTEIFDHPKPYKPPVFRSRDNGKTWEEITGILTWHVVAFQISPRDGYVYALTEGAGLYSSADHGDHWTRLGTGPTVSFALDPNRSNRLFGGAQFSSAHRLDGGVFVSNDGGKTFMPIGIRGVTVSSIVFSPNGNTLFVVAYPSGIYRAQVPQ